MAGSGKQTSFDSIFQQFLSEECGTDLIEQCMNPSKREIKSIPLRYRIIALGFAQGWDLKELNRQLMSQGCGKLYARSIWEAGLIFAFARKLSYEEWKLLENDCAAAREQIESDDDELLQGSFNMEDLQEYLELNSAEMEQGGELLTARPTARFEESLTLTASGSNPEFAAFINSNIDSFALSRERSRYYFCKYMYFWLDGKLESFLNSIKTGRLPDGETMADLIGCFKGLTKLKRKRMELEEIRAELRKAAVSCSAVFAEFNEFFFGYVSIDWMEILLEYYGDPEKLSPVRQKRLADAARKYRSEFKKLSDKEIIRLIKQRSEEQEEEEDRIYSEDSAGKGYQKDRSGENAVRKYVSGRLDPDRTTLICFLLFFGLRTELPEHLKLKEERISAILSDCGFRALTEDDDFDWFVLNFLESGDQTETLMSEVNRYALNEENFYLYRLYQGSKNEDEEFRKIMNL